MNDNMVEVQIIRRKNDLQLVQWDDGATLRRAWITPSMIVEEVDEGKRLIVQSPEEGVPYGEMWNLLLDVSNVTPEQIDREFKRKDIWTIEDLQMKPDVARMALSRLYRLDIVTVLNKAAQKQQATGGNS